MAYLRDRLPLTPLGIGVSYVVFGVVWIAVSDQVVASLAMSESMAVTLQTLKGWAFVGLSGTLIFMLVLLKDTQATAAQSQLETANEELQVFQRVLRHNLRNDMNVILGYIEEVCTELDREPLLEHLSTARSTATQLLDMSEKLKLLDRVDPETARVQTVDLVPLIEQECDRLRTQYPGVTVWTDFPGTAEVRGDESLAYVFRELLENAVEHNGSSPSEVEIDVTVQRAMQLVEVQIADNGPTIPDREVEVFRTGEESKIVHSDGVGLWLVKWLGRMSHASIGFDTESREGTVVSLRFERGQSVTSLVDAAWEQVRQEVDN